MIKSLINKEYIYARAGSFKLFWRIRSIFLSKDFARLRGIFRLRIGADSIGEEVSALKVIFQSIRLPAIGALLLVIGLYTLEYHIATIAELDLIRDNAIGRYLLRPLDHNAYTQLLTTVATVTGIFLGLYFTAISAVIANIYSTVPNDVRELLIRDRLGNVYVRMVSFSTILSVVLLAMSVDSTHPLHLVPPVLALASIVTAFAFVELGKRAFFLSDPTYMSSKLSGDIHTWVRRATYKGWRWRDANFQEHYRKQASKAVSTLVALATISRKRPELRGDSYQNLVTNLVATTRHYFSFKHLIPSDSRWFRKKYQHKQWYLTESTELEMASQVDIALQPKEVPDTGWLEDEMLGIIVRGLEGDVAIDNQEALHNQFALLPHLFNDMGEHWSIEDGQKWCNKITDDILTQIFTQNPQTVKAQPKYSIAIADICGSLPLSLELGFIKTVRTLEVKNLRKQLVKNKWIEDSSPYKFSMPPDVVKALEEIRDSTAFERVSKLPYEAPGWYIVEVASNNIDWALFNRWSQLRSLVESWYVKTGKKLTSKKLYMHAAAIYMRAIEFAWKLDSHVKLLRLTSKALREGAILDFNRPEWEWEKEQEFVAKFRDQSTEELAKLIPNLFQETANSDLPDYFGGAVHRTGESCFDALIKGDVKRFRTLFQLYFVGISGVFDQLRPQVAKWAPSTALTWMSEPIIDLFEISGYSFMLAEFHGNPEIWQASKAVWDKYLSQDQEQRLKFLGGLSYHHKKLFGTISPRATLRVQHQFRFRDLLKELPKQEDWTEPFFEPPVKHPSSFIRLIAPRDSLLLPDAIDIFIVKYLMSLPVATNVDFGVTEAEIKKIQGDQGRPDV